MVEVPSDQEIQDSGSDPDDNFQSTSMEQTTSESLQSDSPSVISLLGRLGSPTPADLARMRQLKQNPPPKGVKRGKGKEKGDPKNISANERVKTYPDEGVIGTLCYVAIQPCSLDSLICACTLITVCKKRNFWKEKWVKEGAKWVNRKRKIGRFIEHKRKAK